MSRAAQLAPFAVAALLAGCGSSSSSSNSSGSAPSSAPASSAGGVTLSETEFKITPAAPAVAQTGKITITAHNNGKIAHALAVQTPAGVVRTGHIAPGASATLTVDVAKAGSYVFYCPIDGHRQSGMQGMLVVGPGAAAAGGATSTTTSTSSSSSGGGYKGY